MDTFKLVAGDTVRVVAPSFSLKIISEDVRSVANKRFAEMGINIEFADYVEEMNGHLSSDINYRVKDLHDAYADKNVKAIFAVIGGYNSNQLLSHLDWNLIKNNPKPLIGYSDTTALQNAILAKTGNISYSGPAYSTFGQEKYFDYTLEHFRKMLFSSGLVAVTPSEFWTDDEWFLDQEKRNVFKNEGWLPIYNGNAEGRIIGGNLGTLSSLFGTCYMPDLKNSILFLEDDECEKFNEFDRMLQSLVHQKDFSGVRAVVLGRFQVESEMNTEYIKELFCNRPEFENIPVIANVDFGHTNPMITYPIGGEAILNVNETGSTIELA
jgi:muramoyltetrapeptide carboxypeptidase LdcA involved in peptidoglycan recycling